MTKLSWRLAGETLLVIGVLLAAYGVLDQAARRVDFFGDEGRYIHRAQFFYYLFIERDVTRPEWGDGDGNLTHTAPMLTHYLIGAALWSGGYRVEHLPRMYSWKASPELNRRWGRVPDEVLLARARLPMVLLGAGSVALLYAIGRVLAGPFAGVAAAALVLISPLAKHHLARSVAEAPLVFFVLLALLLCVLGIRVGGGRGLPMTWALAVGLALGLAVGSKLTAVLSSVAAVGWGVVVAVVAWSRSEADTRLTHAWAAGRGWLLSVAIALGVFVVMNPHLYPNPVLHAYHLADSRLVEMQEAQEYFRTEAVRNPLERPARVLVGSLVSGTFFGSRGLPIEAALAVLGMLALIQRTRHEWRQTRRVPAECFLALTALVYFIGISAGLRLAFERYLIPTFLIGMLFSGVGLSAMIDQLLAAASMVKRRSSLPRAAVGHASPRGVQLSK